MTFGTVIAKTVLWAFAGVLPAALAVMAIGFALPVDQYTFPILWVASLGPIVAVLAIFAHYYRRYRRFRHGGPSPAQRAKYAPIEGTAT